MEPPQAEPSRSFKRRQRRKKQLERLRQAGSRSDQPAAEAAPSRPGHPPPAEAGRADDPATAGRPGAGTAKRRKRRSTGSSDQPAGPGAAPADRPGPPGATPVDRPGPPGAAPADRPGSPGATSADRPSSPGAAPADRPGSPGAAPADRPGSPGAVSADRPGSPGATERRREASPVVSSTEQVLRSIRALQAVLAELRAGLLTAPADRGEPPADRGGPLPADRGGPPTDTGGPPTDRGGPLPADRGGPPTDTGGPPTDRGGPLPEAAMTPPLADSAKPAPQKTKEQIKAERRAKAEAAKLAKAEKAKQKKQQQQQQAAGDGSPAADAAGGRSPPEADQAHRPPARASEKPDRPARETSSSAGEAGKLPAEASKPAAEAGKPVGEPGRPAGEAGRPAGEKSKAELKAERRAKQEAQRAAKAAAAAAAAAKASSKAPTPAKGSKEAATAGRRTAPASEQQQEPDSRSERKTTRRPAERKGLQMFSHLLPFDATGADPLTAKHGVPPALVPLLLRLSAGRPAGGNAGAVALLGALAELVEQYVTPPQKELRRDLPELVRRAVAQLAARRPLSVAMENVAQRLEQVIRHELPADRGDYEAKQYVIEWIESFIRDNICKAMSAITHYADERIKDDDVILTYGRSTAVLDVLSSAQRRGRRFRVLVVDSRPRLDGRDMLRQLLDAGVNCSYGLLTAVSHLMKEATKVLLGAQALLSNGVVLSPAGSALVSLAGRALNRPVLVCCETYKFSDRVQTDSQVYNHLGDPNELVTSPDSPLAGWDKSESLSVLNIAYDVTPPELVDVVITELGAIPCTSVPAVLRLQQSVIY